MTIKTRLCDVLEIEHPLISAPMANVSGGRLAAAVSNAGGLGLIGGGYGDQTWLERELSIAGDTKVGIGFITWALEEKPELLDLALDHDPKALFLSFGSIVNFAPKILGAGVPFIAQIQTVEQARQAAHEGADIIVAQGTEAGGHGGKRATFPLIPAVVDAVGDIPVVAAGGIGDGRGLAAALVLGAQGALCGTAFYACEEALTHPNAKSATIDGSGDDTIQSNVFDIARGHDWPVQWKLRTLKNKFTEQWDEKTDSLIRNADNERPGFIQATKRGDIATAPVIVGEGVDMVKQTESAGIVVERMMREAADRITAISS